MNVLVATRGAARSETTLRLAAGIASHINAGLRVLTVARDGSERAASERSLARARDRLHGLVGDTTVQTRLRTGHSAEEILAELEEGDYTLVVVGEREHHRPLTRLVLGSTAERIIEHAPCPVAVAKGDGRAPRRLLVCDSGAADAPLLDVLAEQLPALLRASDEVTVLYVMSQMSAGPRVETSELTATLDEPTAAGSHASVILERDLERAAALGVTADLKLRHGPVVEEVVAEAADLDADLVIIGANRGTGWRKVLLGDIAREIVRRLHRPVLVMRPARDTDVKSA